MSNDNIVPYPSDFAQLWHVVVLSLLMIEKGTKEVISQATFASSVYY